MMSKSAILYRDELKEYDFGAGHPFRGDRYGNFINLLVQRMPDNNYYDILSSKPATTNELLSICDRDYIKFNKTYYHAIHSGWVGYYEGFSNYQSEDNRPFGYPGDLEEAARLIIGQARTACDLVQSGRYQKAISVGGGMHHARRRFGEGFCIYNDVAFAALYLVQHYGLERVLVLDTDAHAGNGTSDYVHETPNVLFIDIHQDPHTVYPGSGFVTDIGRGATAGRTVNIPLPVNAGNDSYMAAFDEIILPLTREYQPQIIIRNGGSDPYFEDGLTNLGMTMAGFRMMGGKIREMADVCQGKEIDLIASGYNPTTLPAAWLSLLNGINDVPVSIEEPIPVPPHLGHDTVLPETKKVLDEVKRYHRDYWACFQ